MFFQMWFEQLHKKIKPLYTLKSKWCQQNSGVLLTRKRSSCQVMPYLQRKLVPAQKDKMQGKDKNL